MSSALFPHILFLLGLNFINVLCSSAVTGPPHRYAEQLDQLPEMMFYDILKTGDTTWLAGDGIFRLSPDGTLEKAIKDPSVTSILYDEEDNCLWYASSEGVGRLNPVTFATEKVEGSFNFIWNLVFFKDKLWFIESERFGWLDKNNLQIGEVWPCQFTPRPFISVVRSPERIFAGSGDGLWELGEFGKRLIISAEQMNGATIPWICRVGNGYYLGTNQNIYSWSGDRGEPPKPVDSDYASFFKTGINNAVTSGDKIAITQYPTGIVFFDTKTNSVESVVDNGTGVRTGDVFKIIHDGPESLYMLGENGVATVNLSARSRFFPADKLYGSAPVRKALSTAGKGHIFTREKWLEISDEGFVSESLNFAPDWVEIDNRQRLICGSVTAYEILDHASQAISDLEVGVFDLKWGSMGAYALGGEGIYSVSADLEMDLIYPEKKKLHLLGESGNRFYAMTGDGRVIRLNPQKPREADALDGAIEGDFVRAESNTAGVWVASTQGQYRISGDKVQAYELASGWEVLDMSASEKEVAVLYRNRGQNQWALGMYGAEQRAMIAVPFREYIGDPLTLMVSEDFIGIVGSNGTGWYYREELVQLLQPEVDFALLFENRRIEDRTIPAGMHFIDLQVNFTGPSVPCVVQYRINEERWRNVNLLDPSLQFAGHGTFSVELRAVHPNGNVSSSKLIQFGIAPPWYLNPVYQGVMVVMALMTAWLVYYWRSRQLMRTNLWLQNEVKKQTRELEAATAARTNFLAGLSHDIRNPLNGVLMIAETLSRNPPASGDDPRLRDLTEFGIIVDRMLGEILDFSAIDQAKIPTSFMPVSVLDIIESSVKQNQFSIQHEMVSLDTSIPDELKDVVIRTDRNWMIKVLSNLIVNALEYSESPRVEVGARCLRLTENQVQLELYVADWGVGIDDSEKEYVFERFYRGETGIESGKHGTGLGLSICQEIAHAMGGHIRLEDNEPTGCRFVLMGRFDRVEGEKELDKEAILSKLSGKRILIVDDLVYNRRSIVEFFETIGCFCDQAENGREALSLLEKNDYHLALLDWDLPGIMGPEIARRHRRKYPEDPVILIAVTAYTDGEKKRESEEAGMNGYISKPLTATRLAYCLGTIEKWRPERRSDPDKMDADEVQEEIYKHIEDCLHYGEHYEWENLRRCAHRLTTLALIKNNRPMQQVCRDLQIAAAEANIKESQVGLLELQKWRKS